MLPPRPHRVLLAALLTWSKIVQPCTPDHRWWAGRCHQHEHAGVQSGLGGCSRAASREAGPSWGSSSFQDGRSCSLGNGVHAGSAGALEKPRAGPIPPGNREVSREGGRAASASATSGGSLSSVGSAASAGTSTSDDLFPVAALRRSEPTTAYQAMVDQAVIYGDLVRALLAAQARVVQAPLSPAGPSVSGVHRLSHRQLLLKVANAG